MEMCLPFSETGISAVRAADSFRKKENHFFPSTLSPFSTLRFPYPLTTEPGPWF